MTQNKWIALVVVVLLAIAAYIWGPGLMAQINPSGDGNNEAGTGTVENPYRMTIGKVWTFTCPDGKIKTKRQKNGDVTLSCVAKKVSKKAATPEPTPEPTSEPTLKPKVFTQDNVDTSGFHSHQTQ